MNTPIPHRIRPLGRLPLFRATALAALLVALALLTTPTDLAHAGGGPNCHGDWDVCFDLNEGLIVGEGFADETTFMGVPYTATVGEDLTRFFIAGSLDLQGPLTIDFTDDSNLASIWIRGDLRVAPGVVFDASGFERRRGPGGGRGGNDPQRRRRRRGRRPWHIRGRRRR